MGWMSEISIMIEDAERLGVTLRLEDFGRSANTLLIKGVPSEQWFERVREGSKEG